MSPPAIFLENVCILHGNIWNMVLGFDKKYETLFMTNSQICLRRWRFILFAYFWKMWKKQFGTNFNLVSTAIIVLWCRYCILRKSLGIVSLFDVDHFSGNCFFSEISIPRVCEKIVKTDSQKYIKLSML